MRHLDWVTFLDRNGSKSETGVRRVWDVTTAVLLCILASLCTVAVVLTLFSPKGSDGASQIFGYELRIVESNSMEAHEDTDVSEYEVGSFRKGTMIALELVPAREEEAYDWYASVKVGDVLTVRYTYNRQITITHRVTAVTPKDDGSGFIIELQGDNIDSDSTQLTQVIDTSETESRNYVIGRVVWKSYIAGFVIGGFQRILKAFVGE